MRLLRYAIRHAKVPVALAAIIGLLAGAATMATLMMVAKALQGHDPIRTGLTFAALLVVGPALRYASAEILTRFSGREYSGLAERLSRRTVDCDLRSVEQLGSDRLFATLTQDVGAVATAITQVPMLIVNAAIAIGCVAYLAALSFTVFIMVVIATIFAITLHVVVTKPAALRLQSARQEQDTMVSHFRALTNGLSELKLHRARREAFLSTALVAALNGVARLKVEGFGIYNRSASYQQMMFLLALGAGVFGGRLLRADLGMLGGVVLTLFYMRGAVEGVIGSLPTIQQADIALRTYHDVFNRLPPERGPLEAGSPQEAPVVTRFERLELTDLAYAYDATARERFQLGPVSVTMKPGELVFITGGNGSGKTTLAKLIAGLYVPEAGEVRVNGEPVTKQTRDDYRQLVTCVFADFHLFRELLGLQRATLDADAGRWLRRLRLDERVTVERGVLSTLDVSVGQRKRLALLVAMLEDRPICIFDEWAADQDPQYRQEFYTRILPELRERAKLVIVISHDDRYYAIADRIIKLEEGRVVSDETVWPAGVSQAAAPGPIGAAGVSTRPAALASTAID